MTEIEKAVYIQSKLLISKSQCNLKLFQLRSISEKGNGF